MSTIFPKMRVDLNFTPYTHEGSRGLIIKDPMGVLSEPIFLQGIAIPILGLLDGKKNLDDIYHNLQKSYSDLEINLDEIENLITSFNSFYLLDNEYYETAKIKLIEDYKKKTIRKSILAGVSYPKDIVQLQTYLNTIFDNQNNIENGNPIDALISPHIELRVGERVYNKAYQYLKNKPIKRVILMGTGHNIIDSFISLTDKSFETPLGTVDTDTELINVLKQVGQKVISDNDYAHKTEHSLELQILFLQNLLGSDFQIIPILFGSFHPLFKQINRPSSLSEFKGIIDILRDYYMKYRNESIIIAAVDFSHIGLKFGDSLSADSLINETKDHDKKLIQAIKEGNSEEFWRINADVMDTYKVCGFSAIACLLDLLPNPKGYLIDYDVYNELATQSAVTYAAMGLQANNF